MLTDKMLNKLSENIKQPYLDESFKYIERVIDDALNIISSARKIPKNKFVIYKHGACINDITVNKNHHLEIVVELKKTEEENALELNGPPKSNKQQINREVDYDAIYSLKSFKEDLINAIYDITKNNSIKTLPKTILFEKTKNCPLNIQIMPAFTFKLLKSQDKELTSVLIFDEAVNEYVVSFPAVYNYNLTKKDKETNGNFKKIIRAIHRLRDLMVENELTAPEYVQSYFIDCLVYNVPNLLFNDTLEKIYLKIINYLKNASLISFVVINEQLKLFNKTNDGWNIVLAKQFIKLLIYINENLEYDEE